MESTPAARDAAVPAPVALPYEAVCLTGELPGRLTREPDHRAENSALQQLATLLTTDGETLLQQLLQLAMALCGADSAGISLREGDSFRWIATAGAYSAFVGGGTPFEFSPCGRTVHTQKPQLFQRPERHYTYFYSAGAAPMEEALLIPWSAQGRQQGTLWVVTHGLTRHFDAEDVRVLTCLGGFVSAALSSSALNAALLRKERETSELAVARELAHHINNPLQSATLALDLLSMPGMDEQTITKMLPIARDQVGRVAHIVQEILKLKKLPAQ